MRQLEFLFFFLITGYAFRKTPWSRVHAAGLSRLLNQWVIRAALPALVLLKIHALPEFSFSRPELYLPASQPWLQLALAYLVLSALQGPLKWSRKAWGALVLTVGLGNTSFVGFPLLNALLGPDAIPTGIIIDQLGSFLLLSLVGVPFAQAQQGFASKSRWWWLRPLRFPAFQALLVALLLRGVAFPGFFEKSLDAVAATLSPAALLSVGMMLSFGAARRREIRNPLLVGLALKLLVFPALYFLLYPAWAGMVGGLPSIVLGALLLEGAMASQIMAGVVAAENGLEPELARLMVGTSIPLSLITVPLWARLL